jgi:hypothetical protein
MVLAVGKEILVNSAILACGSEYFHKMFSAGMTEAMNKSRPIDIHLSLDGKDSVVRWSSLHALRFQNCKPASSSIECSGLRMALGSFGIPDLI